ncbi:MAG: DUF4231 domain-containing protein [Chloroflexi bacterium]|nr:DUF4231 domain-containing protein [Chloroflexota bacterium]
MSQTLQPGSAITSVADRRQLALDRIDELTADADARAARAWRNYYALQILTVALAAITPCLIFLAKDNPKNEILNWLQLFFPALAAVSAGASHIFRWREDGVRCTQLAESIRSEVWKYETRTAGYRPDQSDDQALDQLVTHVDVFNLQSVSRWASAALTETAASAPQASPARAESS